MVGPINVIFLIHRCPSLAFVISLLTADRKLYFDTMQPKIFA